MITAYPKIFSLGTDYIRDIFNEPVEITEKIDGSQFAFGKVNGELFLRSKGAQLFIDYPNNMFKEGIAYIDQIKDRLPDNTVFYAEYLQRPKHNTLKYNRIPQNHLMLFGVMKTDQSFHTNLEEYAKLLGIEVVPELFKGKIESIKDFEGVLDTESVLGGAKIEGVVVKNYHRQFLLGGQPMPLMAGKFVSEAFKEVHRARWSGEEKGAGRMEAFFESFRTEARWHKAIQHLRDKGELLNEPKDIGNLMREIHMDIEGEEKEAIKEWLWKEFSGQVKRKATAGFPEWYKEHLLARSFTENEEVIA